MALLPQRALGQTADTAAVDRAHAALPESARSTIDTYLRTDCELGQEANALRPVLELGASAKPYLDAVARNGPPADERAALARSVEKAWTARAQLLETARGKEIAAEAPEQVRTLGKHQYEAQQEAALEAKYRERAALALRALEGAAPAPPAGSAPAVASPPAAR